MGFITIQNKIFDIMSQIPGFNATYAGEPDLTADGKYPFVAICAVGGDGKRVTGEDSQRERRFDIRIYQMVSDNPSFDEGRICSLVDSCESLLEKDLVADNFWIISTSVNFQYIEREFRVRVAIISIRVKEIVRIL